jgi:hypothetical protein
MSEDLRIAVLGVGMMGAFHVDALSKRIRGAQVTVVNDFFPDKAAEVAGKIGARAVDDPIEAINDPEVDAVLIASPGAAHNQQVSVCLDRGIPVLCEKPLTTDIASAHAIVEKEKALGKQLIQVGFMRRFDPEYAALRKLIADGGLGNPLVVHCTHRNPAVGDHFNSEFMIRDSVVHEVDVARFLLEEELVSVQVIKGVATGSAPAGTSDPMTRSSSVPVWRTRCGPRSSGRRVALLSVSTRTCSSSRLTAVGVARSLPASSSDSARPTTPSFSAGWTPPGPAQSMVRVPGTATSRSRCARPAYRHCAPAGRPGCISGTAEGSPSRPRRSRSRTSMLPT